MRDDGNAAAHLQRAEQLYVVGRFRGVARQANGGLVVPRRNRRSRFLLATRFRIGYFFKKANPLPQPSHDGNRHGIAERLVPRRARCCACRRCRGRGSRCTPYRRYRVSLARRLEQRLILTRGQRSAHIFLHERPLATPSHPLRIFKV